MASDDLQIKVDTTENSLSKLELEQLYNQYVQEQIDHNVSSQDIASFGYFCSHLAKSWHPQPKPSVNQRAPNQPVSLRHDSRGMRDQSQSERFQREINPGAHVNINQSIMSSSKVNNEAEAAIIIQRVWRRHIDMQVYRYYRDLINFKSRGNPGIMLRCINPNEAKLLDAASGINVRFRLAGERFPPNIYYKIFTTRPIQDMCANSPKDYTRDVAKKLTVKDTHSNVRIQQLPQDDQGNWYKRIENNGWRLVSDRLIHHIMNDSVTWETSKKEYKFDHSRLQRRQDVERRKKEMKIQWMQKMYRDGMLRAKANDYETVQLIEGAAAGMIATVEASGPDALEDWEVDELLDWTTSLNFDEYRSTWTDLATSANSHKIIEDRFRLSTNTSDPYELSLSTGPSRFTSARQSHISVNSGDSTKGGIAV